MSSEQRSLRHRAGKHGSGFEKRSDPVSTVFTADARVFESSRGRLWIVGHAVAHDAPGAYL
jgi:hypothetical protein